ncbi:MAG: hypothetical protein FMNOHCHN_00562 [Ignavibacteriaceae bacterium]|nr:hypothetical protein [Ignavibacteriaceae bacterium]
MFLRFFILLCLFCSSLIFSQSEENGPDFTTAELALYVVNAGSNDQTRFTLSSLDAPIYCNNSSGCMISVASQSHFMDSITIVGSLECDKVGFHAQDCSTFAQSNASCSPSVYLGAKPLKKGYFKLTISVKKSNDTEFTEKGHIYYDNRDSRFPSGAMNGCSPCSTTIANDLFIKFNHSNNSISVSFGNDLDFAQVASGKLLEIGELNALEESCFDNYESRFFAVITSITRSQSNNPLIRWEAPYGSAYDFEHYRVERSVNGGSFDLVDYIYNIEDTSYIDYQVWWDPNSQGSIELTYRILASFENEGMYHYSNQKSILVTEEYPQKKYHAGAESKEPEVTVNPNPFNNSALIQINNIAQESEVFAIDILGQSYPLTKIQSDGNSIVMRFDGTNLTTGIYLVIVKDKNTHFTKKLMLVK